jgi:hypothetical protein
LEEEEETEYSGRGFYFSRTSQVMVLVLIGTSLYGIRLGLAMFQVIYNIQYRKVKYRAGRVGNDGLLTDKIEIERISLKGSPISLRHPYQPLVLFSLFTFFLLFMLI